MLIRRNIPRGCRRAIQSETYLPLSLPSPLAVVEWDDIQQFAGTVIDTTGSPDVFVSEPCLGQNGGTFGSSGGARGVVAKHWGGSAERRVMALDGSARYQTHSGAAALWSQLTGPHTTAVVFKSTLVGSQTVSGTADSSSVSNVGEEIIQLSTGALLWRVSDGVGWIVSATVPAGTIAPGVTVRVECVLTATTYAVYVEGVLATSGVPSRTPTPLTPQSTLVLGNRPVALSLPFGGDLMFWSAHGVGLDTAQRQALEAYELKYSPVYSLTKNSMISLLPLGFVVDETNPAGDGVAGWPDYSGDGHDATVFGGTQSKEPLVTTTPNGLPAARFDGVDDAMLFDVGAGWRALGAHRVAAVFDQRNETSDYNYLLMSDVPASAFAAIANTPGKIGYTGSSGWVSVADAEGGWQLLEFAADISTSLMQVFRNGVLIGEGAWTSRLVGGTVALGNHTTGSARELDGDLAVYNHKAFASTVLDGTWFTDRQDLVNLFAGESWSDTLSKHLSPGGLTLVDPSDAANFKLGAAVDGGGAEELTNGSFESGLSGWAPITAEVTQVAWTVSGWGDYAVQIALAIGEANRYIGQTSLAIGATYHVRAVVCGDGGNGYIRFRDGGGSFLGAGTTSASEQVVDFYFTATSTEFRIYCTGDALTADWARCAGVSITEVLPVVIAFDKTKDFDGLLNPGFEIGSPPNSWTSWSGGILTSQAGARPGGSGSQVIQIVADAGDTFAGAYQTSMVSGVNYAAIGWFKPDGTARGGFYASGIGLGYYTTPGSSSWEEIVVVFNAPNTNITLGVIGTAGVDTVQADDIQLIRGNHFWQPTLANRMPYDAVNRRLVCLGSHYAIGPIPNPTVGAVYVWVWFDNLAAIQAPFGGYDGTNRCYLRPEVGGALTVGLGTVSWSSGLSVAAGQWLKMALEWDSSGIYAFVDAASASNMTAGRVACTTALGMGSSINSGAMAWPMTGKLGALMHFGRRPTAAERADWFEKYKPPGAP